MISQKIKIFRELNNLSIKEFSEILNIREDLLFDFEKGKSYPSFEILVRMAICLNITLDDLVDKDSLKKIEKEITLIDMVSSNIQSLRIKRNISRKELAKSLNISQAKIILWDQGNSLPSYSELISLSNFFNVSIDSLFNNNIYSYFNLSLDYIEVALELQKKSYNIEDCRRVIKYLDNKNSHGIYELFELWLDSILKSPLPNTIKAFCFNIYETVEKRYELELIGSETFNILDESWAKNDDIFHSRKNNNILAIDKNQLGNRKDALDCIKLLIIKYLISGKFSDVLINKSGLAYGFIDEDIKLLDLYEFKKI